LKQNKNKFLITEEAMENSSAAHDVFLNIFDITWAKNLESNASKKLTIVPVELNNPNNKVVDDGSIIYNYNNEWFRSDDFTTQHPQKYHVLFAGCSETEGVGGNVETIWTKMLHESLKKKYAIDGFYSIAKAGFGWQKIITNFMIYVKKYGPPTHLFILMPNIDRMFEWIEGKSTWIYSQKLPFSFGKSENKNDNDRIPSEAEHMKMFVDFTVSWKLFEEYCKGLGTRLLWTTWDSEEDPNFLFFKQHESFFEISEIRGKVSFENFLKTKKPDGKIKKDDLVRRDGHSGNLFHMFWKESFEKEIEARGLFDD
jgi:hypothetical protein